MKKELLIQKNPKTPIAETFRTLRTNLQFMNAKNGLQTILITSTVPGEGKTWVSSNLAVTFALTGKKVLLIDADMRKGRIAKVFQARPTPGLSNFLSGINENDNIETRSGVLNFVQTTGVDNLYVMTSGNIPPNPAELLETDVTVNMIEELKEKFDIVIFDGTPSMLVTDATILSRLVDTTVIVSAYNLTKKEDLVKVKRNIENVGGKIAGVVFNKVPGKSKAYRYGYYYGHPEK